MARRIVVVGGGIAGVSTVAALRSGGFDGDLTLLDAGDLPYDRPPLSKAFLKGDQDLDAIALQPAQWYDDHSIRLVNRTTATRLRTGEATVELSDGTALAADRVVLATGGRAARPPIPGGDSPNVHVIRTAQDAARLRSALAPGARLLVVGAGLIGAEVASTALGLGCEVVLADPVRPPLAPVLGAEAALWLHDLHAHRGVTTVQAGVESFTDTADGIEARFTGGATVSADAVVLAVGMTPETSLAEAAGLEVDRGIVVDAGQVTSNPAVLAVGDPARIRRGGVALPRTEHWEAAQHGGRRAAATILGLAAPEDTAHWFWTDRHGLHVEAVGAMAAASTTVLRGRIGEPPFSIFGLAGGRLVGAAAVDDSTAVRAARRIIDRGLAVDPERLADPSTDLRRLLRGRER
jgi:3-phenylpropionate/trans-cinnamate dioxygenase ferredoxin reductase component